MAAEWCWNWPCPSPGWPSLSQYRIWKRNGTWASRTMLACKDIRPCRHESTPGSSTHSGIKEFASANIQRNKDGNISSWTHWIAKEIENYRGHTESQRKLKTIMDTWRNIKTTDSADCRCEMSRVTQRLRCQSLLTSGMRVRQREWGANVCSLQKWECSR